MNIKVLSLFPEILEAYFSASIMKRAVGKGLVSFELVNIRDYAYDKHRKCDDEVFGGGAGMLLKPEPLDRALAAAGSPEVRTVYVTPSGRLFNQAMAADFAKEENLVILCGRYEGIDQRIIDTRVTDVVSIGDYVLSSGEVAAMVVIDAVYRLVPGVISGESLSEESFSAGLLEYPQYTRPEEYGNMHVPEVLVSGNHAAIARWRLRASLIKTLAYRPELLQTIDLTGEIGRLLKEVIDGGGENEPRAANSGGTGKN
ncbi:MAG: tRNA (guanosine(37)-N1)-methyltransferase TrmD [Spirochaetota bacterium]|jgi:tRNA (guanine37-N1)-methyltransferase|uniref:tRNA (guanine-N(1)-)-methyltransferase n=1 Tax=uncultured spirochete TaxID=156406 RepID=A0A3P3XKX0_9SPIR|nr:tRNA (guanosine(37)-N1)-methyltransferase TrmD [Rectinema subterraneum]SLM15052.1 tRNA (guanine-1-)-methyltransferase [uncultured spirochete]HBE46006.1 tRNA (guanosine(37)-N1)-methyltransferase TrmD [Spirochaetaceae bacterium]HCX95933.1 tRNA (guanosine(37)-N1)-methyltransferase TrmD [Spirochaetaceae bacterium]